MYNKPQETANKVPRKRTSIQNQPLNLKSRQTKQRNISSNRKIKDNQKMQHKIQTNRTLGSTSKLSTNNIQKIQKRPAPNNIPKPQIKNKPNTSKQIGFPKLTQMRKKNKNQYPSHGTWSTLACDTLINICQYACADFIQVYKFSRICSLWRNHMMSDMGECFWSHVKGGEQITTFYDLKLKLQKVIVQEQEKACLDFQKLFTKLFNYGSTKQNIPNKLLQKLNLEIEIKLNKNAMTKQPFKLRNFNFSSYICMKVSQISQYKYDFTTPHNMFKDKINLQINFRSLKYKVSHQIKKSYNPEQIYETSIKQKAFDYYLDKNFVFTFFQGDDHFLYIFFEMSALELVNIFRKIIKHKHSETLQKRSKKLPLYKQLCETQFQSFTQYMKFQADFEIHFSYHNTLKQIFTHCDTKVYPIQIGAKQALFDVKIEDTYDKVATYKLDNKMGISESVKDLYLLDFILKDRDRFLIIFSGFIYARNATAKERQQIEDYFNFAQNQIKIIEYKKQKQFSIKFTIIEQNKRNLMKNVTFQIFSNLVSL